MQIVSDSRSRILNAYVNSPGSMNDCRMLRRSPLHRLVRQGMLPRVGAQGWFETVILVSSDSLLLADNGYVTTRHVITPILRTHNGRQRNYNRAHKRTRRVVESAIGEWKNAWRLSS